jgi:hypothetical protein
VRPVQFHRVAALDLDGPRAAPALDPKQFARNLRQPHLLEGQPWPSGGARVPEKLGGSVILRLARPAKTLSVSRF